MCAKKAVKKPSKSKAKQGRSSNVFSAEERAAAKETAAERKRQSQGKYDGESDVLAKIAEMKGSDRAMAKRIHEIVKANAPALARP